MKKLVTLCAVLSITGCASDLRVYDGTGKSLLGIPFAQPMLVKVIKTTSYKPVDGTPAALAKLCNENKVVESYDYLASDKINYINIDASELSKSSFEVSLSEKGLLTKVTVNSDADSGAEAATGLLSAIAPLLKVTKAEKLTAELTRENQTVAASQGNKDFQPGAKPLQSGVPVAKVKAAVCLDAGTTIQIEPLIIQD